MLNYIKFSIIFYLKNKYSFIKKSKNKYYNIIIVHFTIYWVKFSHFFQKRGSWEIKNFNLLKYIFEVKYYEFEWCETDITINKQY